jgi:hypothetical protein
MNSDGSSDVSELFPTDAPPPSPPEPTPDPAIVQQDLTAPFERMAEPSADEPETFDGGHDGLSRAAEELSNRRSNLEQEPISRAYIMPDGSPSKANEFVSVRRGDA